MDNNLTDIETGALVSLEPRTELFRYSLQFLLLHHSSFRDVDWTVVDKMTLPSIGRPKDEMTTNTWLLLRPVLANEATAFAHTRWVRVWSSNYHVELKQPVEA